jgi:hypothetical protein
MRKNAIAVLALASVAVLALAAARDGAPDGTGAAAPAEGPAASPALEPLAFMAGTWTQQQAKGAMIEEHWMRPRGASMLGSFRRLLGNGAVPFYEFTQIVAEKDRVVLRQIHVHGNFDTDPRRAEPMTLKLDRLDATSVSFVPVDDPEKAKAGSLSRVTYTRVDPTTLLLVVEPKPAKEGAPAEKPLEFRMTLAKP